MTQKYFKKRNQTGFTLIELMVSISVFSVVMVISMGAILTVLDSNRKSQSIRAVMDNLNYSLEDMTRDIRFGKSYHCGTVVAIPMPPLDCASGATTMTVIDSNDANVTYSLSGNKIVKTVSNGTNNGTFDMTSPDVTITSVTGLTFYVTGSTVSDASQPKVIITIKGYAGKKPSTQSNFNLETTLSQREFDY